MQHKTEQAKGNVESKQRQSTLKNFIGFLLDGKVVDGISHDEGED